MSTLTKPPPLIDELCAVTVLPVPPLTEENKPLAVPAEPPVTDADSIASDVFLCASTNRREPTTRCVPDASAYRRTLVADDVIFASADGCERTTCVVIRSTGNDSVYGLLTEFAKRRRFHLSSCNLSAHAEDENYAIRLSAARRPRCSR